MNTTVIEVVIENGTITAKHPELLPAKGRGVLRLVNSPRRASDKPMQRVKFPIIKGTPGNVINPTKAELEASMWGDE